MTAQTLASARVLLIIGGGVAAYKSLDLIRRLRERGATVRVAMTAAAQQFVTPLSAEALSGQPVRTDLFAPTEQSGMGHIEFSREADLVVVAPATADLIAHMALGLADDLATTTLLATDKRALVAPAMNLRMWLHPATQRNVATLRGDGVLFVGPDDGEMACGEYGPGRMAEPLAIVAAVERALQAPTAIPLPPGVGLPRGGALAGRRIVVTSGPTHEPIDPVRYLGNRSSGRQGHAIAEAARAAGAETILVSGPTALADPPGVKVVRGRDGARDARRDDRGAAGRRLRRGGGGRRLAGRRRRRREDQEARRRRADPAARREPRHSRRGLGAPRRSAGARRRLRRRDAGADRQRARQARAQGLRPDRRQ